MKSLDYLSLSINILFIFLLNDIKSDDNFNELNGNNFHEKSKYFKENNKKFEKWKKYYDLIEISKQNYNQINVNINKTNSNSCECYLNLLENDLNYWKNSGISEDLISETKSQTHGIQYQIFEHKLFREKECLFPSRCEGVEHFIMKIIDRLPDMDLIINVRDYPQVYKSWKAFPIFSFSKDMTQNIDITYPAWTFWCGGPAIDRYPVGIGRWDLMRETIVKNSVDWNHKELIAFFRGSRTSSDRDSLIRLSRAQPHLVRAHYTANQSWRSKADTLGEDPMPTVTFEDQCKYKYLFNLRGVAASFRYKHLFLCKSLVLNVESNWIEFFYPQLKPWVHYVPIHKDFSDTEDILHFLHENDELAKDIAEEGFNFIWNHLTLDSVECYWEQLLTRYAKLLTYKPIFNTNLIQIKSRL